MISLCFHFPVHQIFRFIFPSNLYFIFSVSVPWIYISLKSIFQFCRGGNLYLFQIYISFFRCTDFYKSIFTTDISFQFSPALLFRFIFLSNLYFIGTTQIYIHDRHNFHFVVAVIYTCFKSIFLYLEAIYIFRKSIIFSFLYFPQIYNLYLS